jgi:dihydrofolate synthase/folylpolyglutamate synthase
LPLPPGPASDLASWLSYLERLHPATIELGLERVARVRDRLALAPPFPLITVGGTNGKGSTCAMLESVLKSAGYRIGCYASPHLLRYNERVRIGGIEVADASLVAAFERVEEARGDVSLTYFEFGTLAAVLLFQDAGLDVAVLEVGLGGRLDAVNAFEPDCAVVVSIGLDHTEYLGPTLGHIGYEKAGIFRAGKPAVVAEIEPPPTLLEHAHKIGADLYLIERDFGYVVGQQQWQFWDWRGKRGGLPLPALRGRYQLANASAALAALDSLRDSLPVDMGAIRRGLVEVDLPGRFQRGRRLAVFAMLKDKDIEGVIAAVRAQVDEWLVAPLPGARGADLVRMQEALKAASVTAPVQSFASVTAAFARARERAVADDKILVFGSFYTVADALRSLTNN